MLTLLSHHDAYECKTNAFIDSTTDFDDFDDFDDTKIVFKVVVVVVVLCAPSEGAKRTTRQSRDATFTTRGVRALFSRDDFKSRRWNDDDDFDDDDEKNVPHRSGRESDGDDQNAETNQSGRVLEREGEREIRRAKKKRALRCAHLVVARVTHESSFSPSFFQTHEFLSN